MFENCQIWYISNEQIDRFGAKVKVYIAIVTDRNHNKTSFIIVIIGTLEVNSNNIM